MSEYGAEAPAPFEPAGAGSKQLVLATRNRGKVTELRRILAEVGLGEVDILDLDAADALPTGPVPEVAETGLTFAENALLKAHAVAAHTQLPAVADDSGLCVDVMGGSPGIFSARWAGRHGDDLANLELLLAQLGDVPDGERSAYFGCAAVLATPDRHEWLCEGQMYGQIIREPRGEGGFGYDPIFVPDGHSRTTAEMTADEKDAISHRGAAFRTLSAHIVALLDPSIPIQHRD